MDEPLDAMFATAREQSPGPEDIRTVIIVVAPPHTDLRRHVEYGLDASARLRHCGTILQRRANESDAQFFQIRRRRSSQYRDGTSFHSQALHEAFAEKASAASHQRGNAGELD